MRVFLSYDSADGKSAKELAKRLSAVGFEIWDSAQELLPGDNWALKVGKALEESEAMIVLLSPEGVKSEWVRREIEYAIGSRKYEGRLIPVLVRPTSDIPWVLRHFHVVRADKERDEATKQIVDQLRPAS
jgi:hypothetical protein